MTAGSDRPSHPASSARAPASLRWEVRVSALDVRTMTLDELVDCWRTGLVGGEVRCRRAGTLAWSRLRDLGEVRERMDRGGSSCGFAPVATPPREAVPLEHPPPRLSALRSAPTLQLGDAPTPETPQASLSLAPISLGPTRHGPGHRFSLTVASVAAVLAVAVTILVLARPAPEATVAVAEDGEPTGSRPVIGAPRTVDSEAWVDPAAPPSVPPALTGPASAPAMSGRTAPTSPGPVPRATPPDAVRTEAALANAARAAASCARPGGPSGPGAASVVLAPGTGRPSFVRLDDTYAGTDVGGCLLDVMHGIRTAPFTGAPLSRTVDFTIPVEKPRR